MSEIKSLSPHRKPDDIFSPPELAEKVEKLVQETVKIIQANKTSIFIATYVLTRAEIILKETSSPTSQPIIKRPEKSSRRAA